MVKPKRRHFVILRRLQTVAQLPTFSIQRTLLLLKWVNFWNPNPCKESVAQVRMLKAGNGSVEMVSRLRLKVNWVGLGQCKAFHGATNRWTLEQLSMLHDAKILCAVLLQQNSQTCPLSLFYTTTCYQWNFVSVENEKRNEWESVNF